MKRPVLIRNKKLLTLTTALGIVTALTIASFSVETMATVTVIDPATDQPAATVDPNRMQTILDGQNDTATQDQPTATIANTATTTPEQSTQPTATPAGTASETQRTNTDTQTNANSAAATGTRSADGQTQTTGASTEQTGQQDGAELTDDMPDWTEKLMTGRGESEEGFTGNSSKGAEMTGEFMEYEGGLDPVSGNPLNEDGTVDDSEEVRVELTDRMSYDRTLGGFVFYSQRFDAEIVSSVADGMVIQSAASIRVPENVAATLYKDGEAVENANLLSVSEPGAYVVRLGTGSDTEDLLSFTVITTQTGKINYYDMPEGFQVDSVTIDGKSVNNNVTRVEMVTEGEFEIEYSCPRAGTNYRLHVVIDHTPPELTFIGVNENGMARGPVTWEGLGPGESVTFIRDGKQYRSKSGTITQTGDYEITAVDQAGNESVYYVTILLYLNAQSVVFFALFVAIIAAVIIYLQYERKRLRVR